MMGTVFDVKEMALHDGPGIRTTVFLKGCPLRCRWCHNPDGLSPLPELAFYAARCGHCDLCRKPCTHAECQPFGRCLHVCPANALQIVGREVDDAALARELLAGAAVMGEEFGGVTFSGGEPLLQAEFVLAVAAHLQGVHLAIETSGYTDEATFRRVIAAMDYVMLDIKLADDGLHRRYTGQSNARILQNYGILRESGVPYLIRTPLIPGITDTAENLQAIAAIVGDDPWEKLPYNELAGAKYAMLGKTYDLYG